MNTEKLETALSKALPLLEGAKKNSANPHFKSKYADLGSVIDAIRPVAEHGIWFRQATNECDDGVKVETFYIGHGAAISAGVLHMPADKRNPQGFGSALTYARRYALQTAFGLATEDDDGNAASATEQPKRQATPAKTPAYSKLKTELRQFVHELHGCGDADELNAFLKTAEALRIVRETREKLPHLWDGEDWPEGMDRPGEFMPLADVIDKRQRECALRTAEYLQG